MPSRKRPILGVTIDPCLKATIEGEAQRRGVSQGRLIEALIRPGVRQLLSGNYDLALDGDGGFMLKQVQG